MKSNTCMGCNMSTAYWAQWDHDDLMSMQGVDADEYEKEENDIDYDEEEEEGHGCCGNCMKCLGMTWADFM